MKNLPKYILIASLIFVQSLNQTYASSKGNDTKVIKEKTFQIVTFFSVSFRLNKLKANY